MFFISGWLDVTEVMVLPSANNEDVGDSCIDC